MRSGSQYFSARIPEVGERHPGTFPVSTVTYLNTFAESPQVLATRKLASSNRTCHSLQFFEALNYVSRSFRWRIYIACLSYFYQCSADSFYQSAVLVFVGTARNRKNRILGIAVRLQALSGSGMHLSRNGGGSIASERLAQHFSVKINTDVAFHRVFERVDRNWPLARNDLPIARASLSHFVRTIADLSVEKIHAVPPEP